MLTFVVKYLHYAKVLKVEEFSTQNIVDELNKKLPAEAQIKGHAHIQCYSEDFKEYLDIDDEDEVSSGKLLITTHEVAPAAAPPLPPASTVPSSTSGNPQEVDDLNAPLQPLSTQNTNGGAGKKTFPVVYRLPTFPPRVGRLLSSGKIKDQKRVRDSPDLCSLMLNQIKYQLEEYTDYPHSKYSLVVSTLTSKYEGLKDEKRKDSPGFNRNMNLIRKLRSKFKYLRGSDKHESDLRREMKAKYGPSSQSPRTDQLEQNVRRRVVRPLLHNKVDNLCVGETDATMKLHREKLIFEWNSRDPRMNVVRDRLERTALHRLRLYDGSPTDVHSEYPMLMDCFQILCDFNLFFGIDIQVLRREWFTDERVEFLMMKIRRARGIKEYKVAEETDSKEVKMRCVISLLPLLFREKPQFWMFSNDTTDTDIPKIYANTQSSNEPIWACENASFIIKGLNSVICNNPPDIFSAVDCLIAAFYLYNVHFPSFVDKTLRFLTEEVIGLPSTKTLPQSMATLMNEMASYLASDRCQSDDESELENSDVIDHGDMSVDSPE